MDSSDKNSKLDEDVKTYCDVLRSCSLPEVGDWKEEDLERVFRWSNYFKKVHSRCATRASLMEKFDKRFRELGRRGGWRFGGEPLSCVFLGQSQQYLTKALLENLALSAELRENLLHKYEESEGKEAVEILVKHVEELDKSRQLLTLLHTMKMTVSKHVESCHPNSSLPLGEVSVDAECLLEEVHWLLSLEQAAREPGAVPASEALIHKKLHGLTLEAKGGIEVVLQSLLTAPGATNTPKTLAPISPELIERERRVILDWLLEQLRETSKDKATSSCLSKVTGFQERLLLECPPTLLANVSTIHLSFLTEYVQLLLTKVEELDRCSVYRAISLNTFDCGAEQGITGDVTSGSLATKKDHTTTTTSSSTEKEKCNYDVLAHHFKTLAKSGQHAKEVCVTLLKSKIQPPISEKFHLPPMVGTIWNRLLHAVTFP